MIVVEHHGVDDDGIEVIEKIQNVRNIFVGKTIMQIIVMKGKKATPIEKPIRWVNEIYYEE